MNKDEREVNAYERLLVCPIVSVQKCHNAPICGLFVKLANFIFKFLSLKISLIQADCHWK